MASWASRRKFKYGIIVMAALIIFVGIPLFYLFYKAPTCFDGKQNGNETGLDCGGSCRKLCQSAFLPPKIKWGGVKFEKLIEGYYNASSYIINPNVSGAAINVPYKMSFFDNLGLLITERRGVVTLPAHRDALAFQTGIDMGKRIPTKATFEFLAPPVWFKSHDTLGGIAVTDKRYKDDGNSSSLEVVLQNKTLFPYEKILVSAVLYDINGNAIGFSQTNIDKIAPNSEEVAPFTWPINRDGRVTSIDVIPSALPVMDR